VVHYLCGRFHEAPVDLSHLHINDMELLAHIMAVTLLLPLSDVPYRGIVAHVDNKCALSWLLNLSCHMDADPKGSRARRLRLLQLYALQLDAIDLVVDGAYVKSSDNTGADDLSRGSVTDFLCAFPDAVRVQVPRQWWTRWTSVLLR
jgi:hypothetical protein